MKVLVTGATGFVGRALCHTLLRQGQAVVATVRGPGHPAQETPVGQALQYIAVGGLSGETDWHMALEGGHAVVHLAARVHVMQDTARDPLQAFRRINTDATARLAMQAVEAGVRRFVYVSSIKVNGEGGQSPYKETDIPAPSGPYAQSKWEAEQKLQEISAATGLELVILRPPLIYGPGVSANFLRLMQSVRRGLPLPLGGIHNRRSLLFLDNFTDVIARCLEHPRAAGETFLVCDGEAVSTPELIRLIANAMGVSPRLWPVPERAMKLVASLLRKTPELQRLLGSLELDCSKLRQVLAWQPPYTMASGVQATVEAFLEAERF